MEYEEFLNKQFKEARAFSLTLDKVYNIMKQRKLIFLDIF